MVSSIVLTKNLKKNTGKQGSVVNSNSGLQVDIVPPEFLLEMSCEPTSSKPISQYFSLKILNFLLIVILALFLTSFLYQKRVEKFESSINQLKFDDFNHRFGRKHDNLHDFKRRFEIFVENLKKIETLNSENSGVRFTINQFSDRTDAELRGMVMDEELTTNFNFTMLNFFNGTFPEAFGLMNRARPSFKNWTDEGKVMSVKNQRPCASGWAFATVATVESQSAIRKGKLWSLSEQEVVDCDGWNNGCIGGNMGNAMEWVILNGLETEDDYPYEAVRHDQCYMNGEKTRVRVDGAFIFPNNEDIIADWVAAAGPVSFVMAVPSSIFSYSKGIYHPSKEECNSTNDRHAMTIVGYGSDQGQSYWLVKNSWGESWGDKGYMKLARGDKVCGMSELVIGPIIT